MIYIEKILFLIGSPKEDQSISNTIAKYLENRIKHKYIEIDKIYLNKAIRSNDQIIEMFNSINSSNIIILFSPVYFNGLPAIVIKSMELILNYRNFSKDRIPLFYAIVNCGLPEIYNTETALLISKHFAMKSNFKWGEGIGISMGPAIIINKKDSEISLRKNIKYLLDKVADAIIEQKSLPDELTNFSRKLLMPVSIYNYLTNRYFRIEAKLNGVKDKLKNKPYK